MNNLPSVGRYMYAIPIAIFGLFHFMNGSQMAGMVPSFIPGGVFWVYLTGLALLGAAVAIIIQKKAKTATRLLGLMLVIFAVTIHLMTVINGNMEAGMPALLKDIALAGGAWFMSGHLPD